MTEGDPNDQTKTSMAPGFRKGQEESLGTASFAFVGENVMERLRLDQAWRQQLEPLIADEANCASPTQLPALEEWLELWMSFTLTFTTSPFQHHLPQSFIQLKAQSGCQSG